MLKEKLLEIYSKRVEELKSMGIEYPIVEGMYFMQSAVVCDEGKSLPFVIAHGQWQPLDCKSESIFRLLRLDGLFVHNEDLELIRAVLYKSFIRVDKVEVVCTENGAEISPKMKITWDILEMFEVRDYYKNAKNG